MKLLFIFVVLQFTFLKGQDVCRLNKCYRSLDKNYIDVLRYSPFRDNSSLYKKYSDELDLIISQIKTPDFVSDIKKLHEKITKESNNVLDILEKTKDIKDTITTINLNVEILKKLSDKHKEAKTVCETCGTSIKELEEKMKELGKSIETIVGSGKNTVDDLKKYIDESLGEYKKDIEEVNKIKNNSTENKLKFDSIKLPEIIYQDELSGEKKTLPTKNLYDIIEKNKRILDELGEDLKKNNKISNILTTSKEDLDKITRFIEELNKGIPEIYKYKSSLKQDIEKYRDKIVKTNDKLDEYVKKSKKLVDKRISEIKNENEKEFQLTNEYFDKLSKVNLGDLENRIKKWKGLKDVDIIKEIVDEAKDYDVVSSQHSPEPVKSDNNGKP